MLTGSQFKDRDLEDIYFNGAPRRGNNIPHSQQAACKRRLDSLGVAVLPTDLDLPGFGFSRTGTTYLVSVGSGNKITYEWVNNQPEKIDYV